MILIISHVAPILTHTHTPTLCVWIVYLLVYRWLVVPHTPLMVPQNCITTHGSTLYSITINHAVFSFTRNYFYRWSTEICCHVVCWSAEMLPRGLLINWDMLSRGLLISWDAVTWSVDQLRYAVTWSVDQLRYAVTWSIDFNSWRLCNMVSWFPTAVAATWASDSQQLQQPLEHLIPNSCSSHLSIWFPTAVIKDDASMWSADTAALSADFQQLSFRQQILKE